MSHYPKTVKEKAGDAEVVIRKIKNRGREIFRLEYYVDGEFKTKLRADECDAERDAKGLLALLNNRAPVFHETEDGVIFHNAKTILAGTGFQVDLVCRDWMNAYRKLDGVSLEEVIDFYKKHQPAVGGKTAGGLVDTFLAEKERELVYENFKRMRSRLKRFKKKFGNEKLQTVTALDLKAWMRSFVFNNRTLNNERAVLVQFFRWARENNFLPDEVKTAPEKIKKLRADGEPEIFSIAEVTKLLTALESEKSDLLPYAAIGFFAGVRPAEMARLAWSDVRWDHDDIEIKASIAKTGVRRLTKLQENLKAWLAPYRDDSGPIAPIDADEKLSAFAKKHGFDEWPRDVMRHSSISYLVAKLQQIGQVALWHGNSEHVVKKHYLELVTVKEGEAYFEIMPGLPANVIPMKAKKAEKKAKAKVA